MSDSGSCDLSSLCPADRRESQRATEEEADTQETQVEVEVEHYGAEGRAFKVDMARVYSSGRGQERESLQISAEGKLHVSFCQEGV